LGSDVTVVIKAATAKQIDALMADLASEGAAKREAAVARLIVIGTRAVERLAALAGDFGARSVARVAALGALEAIADVRALRIALQAFDDPDPGVASAAIGLARVFLRGPRGVAALDRLTTLALDLRRTEPIRLAAIRALGDLGPSTLKPLFETLQEDPSSQIRALAQPRGPATAPLGDPKRRLANASLRALPDDPTAVRRAIAQGADTLALGVLHRLIEQVREREGSEPASRRAEWMTTRAAAHAALAKRGSRLGLYDVREALDTATSPLPVEFLAALTAVGDVWCLEAIAAAYARALKSGRPRDDWWRRHLADAFRAIVGRERITRRHGVMKKIEKRWPEILVTG
jgi:hypothetical protein